MELTTDWIEWLVLGIGHELMLFAAVGILLIGLDDLLFDALWLGTGGDSHRNRSNAALNERRAVEGTLAIFLPAWDEESVIAASLRDALSKWDCEDFRIYVGCYPNDAATLFAVSPLVARDPRLRLVIGKSAGPTTKADNLNQLWRAMLADEHRENMRFAGAVLHDAEDFVHAGEIEIYRKHLGLHAMVQIPVVPIIDRASRWIGGHYADEFAEAHGKEMPLRARLALPLPSAGVGCALSRSALSLLALRRDGRPFREDSLTEDYELGILISDCGLSSTFVDAHDVHYGRVVSRGAFPNDVEGATRQKARWVAGIALAGWDHLGWSAGPLNAESERKDRSWLTRWMLWRDRRAPLAAIILLATYAAFCVAGLGWAGQSLLGWEVPVLSQTMQLLLAFNLALLLWRLAMRGYFTARCYGWQQGAMAVPRAFISNVIAILAARRAMILYSRILRSRNVVWDKTAHERVEVFHPVQPETISLR